MVLRFDLDLEGMLKLAGFPEQDYHDYGTEIRFHSEEYEAPFKVAFIFDYSGESSPGNGSEDFRGFYTRQVRKIKIGSWFSGAYVFSETISNIHWHQGAAARETLVEIYQPGMQQDGKLYSVVKFSNPAGIEWDYKSVLEQNKQKMDGRRHWLTCVAEDNHPLTVSYQDNGKTCLQLLCINSYIS